MKKNLEYIEKTLKSTEVFSGSVVRLCLDDVEFPDGKKAKRELVDHHGGVCIVAVDSDEKILLVRQYRYAMKEVVLELPAGKLEKGEDPKTAGIRELSEETGATAERFEFLGKMYPTVGYDNEVIYFYLAKNLVFGKQHFDEYEYVELERYSLDALLSMIKSGGLPDAKTVFGIVTYAMRENKIS